MAENTISLHYEKGWLLFYMVQSIFISTKQLLCSAHLNFGNSTDKFLHLMYAQFFLSQLSQIPVCALETQMIIKCVYIKTFLY